MRIYVHDASGAHTLDLDDPATPLTKAVPVDGQERLWPENSDEPLLADATVADIGNGRTGHVHRGRGLITVTVTYNGLVESRDFGPGTTIERLFEWVTGRRGFNVDPAAAADLVLRLPGTEDDLDPGTHIGTLVSKAKALALDLLPAQRFAG